MNYELVLGLEVHLQLKTEFKMFSRAKNDPFFSEANQNVTPVCLGLPGAMPVPNKDAIMAAQRFALAMNSELNQKIIFERKNYFYPDLTKGYQITCPHYPIGIGGELDLGYFYEGVKIRLREVHLEEDTGKSMHKGDKTWLDYNKAGVPLLEIVTEPDFHSIDSAVAYCKEIQLIARTLGISEADMEKGHMRLEANISMRKPGDMALPNYRVELKNINSFGFMKKALGYEMKRQEEALDKSEILFQETRGYNETEGRTFSQRSKEEANDYRYFPEPDIPPIEVDDEWIAQVKDSMPELPMQKRERLLDEGLSKQDAEVLVNDSGLLEKYQELVKMGLENKSAANLVINKQEYKNKPASEIIELEKSKSIDKLTDELVLTGIIKTVLSSNEKVVNDYKSGNQNSIQFLMGQVMKESKGKADASVARKILLELVDKM
jgi:aspartyl-tRNA(Asn)/glutamyl-tRNA(Gln) amidotransferase subunit B